jgi:hypothetical protein
MILRDVRRRISTLERSTPLLISAAVFSARVEEHARRTGTSVEASVESLVRELSDDELHRLANEFELIRFGGDIAARDAAKRKVLMEFDPGTRV